MSGNSFQEMLDKVLVAMAAKGDAKKVEELLSMGGRVDARDQGFTPLLVATRYGHTEVCDLLLANGGDLEEKKPVTEETALHLAAVLGHESLLQLLLSYKANINSKSRTGSTPRHLASQEGHLASVLTLLQAGADLLLPDDNGVLPIHLAAHRNHHGVIRILIEEGGCSPDQVRHTALQSIDLLIFHPHIHHCLFVAAKHKV